MELTYGQLSVLLAAAGKRWPHALKQQWKRMTERRLQWIANGKPAKDIAKEEGISLGFLYVWAARHNVKFKKGK